MTTCTQGWTYENGNLQLRGSTPSKPALERSLVKFENEGCACGKGLDCPLMTYLLNDDGSDNEPQNFDQPFPVVQTQDIITHHNPAVEENGWDEEDDYTEDEDEEDLDDESDIDMSKYDFADSGTYQENPMTSFNESDLVNDVFRPSAEIYSAEEDAKMRTGAGHLIDEIEEQQAQIGTYADTTIRLQQENRVLREKLDEMEIQVNQQLREIAQRQTQQGDVERMISDTKQVNKELTWAIVNCLKMLKFLPDASKMNFRNSRDFKRMLEIYKEHVEPHKGEVR